MCFTIKKGDRSSSQAAVRACALLILVSFGPVSTAQIVSSEDIELSSCSELSISFENPLWRGKVINPVLRSSSDVAEAVEEARRILDCLDAPGEAAASEWAGVIGYHLRLFLEFAAPERDVAGSEVARVDLGTTTDPAVRKLREEVGLSPPDGWIFVRYFSDRRRLPAPIRPAFENPQTQAVTIGTRYVAVLTPAPRSLAHSAALKDGLEATISHELVHAFLNAGLGPAALDAGFPRWFHEGMAIHFSESGRSHVAFDPMSGVFWRIEPTVQYERYERVFEYLESQLGRDWFRRTVRDAVEGADAGLLFHAAGMKSYDELAAAADVWWRWWPIPAGWVAAGGRWWLVLAAAGLALAVVVWRRWQPAIPGSALEVGLNIDLIDAAKNGEVESVRYLLRSGAAVNAEDETGWPALMWAVWLDRSDLAEALLDGGARVTSRIRHLAALRNGSSAIERLLADADARQNNSGQ